MVDIGSNQSETVRKVPRKTSKGPPYSTQQDLEIKCAVNDSSISLRQGQQT